MGNICLYDEAFTKREMREETGRCGICKIAECDYSAVNCAPVRRGEWIKSRKSMSEFLVTLADCSECGFTTNFNFPYCPKCGAKME